MRTTHCRSSSRTRTGRRPALLLDQSHQQLRDPQLRPQHTAGEITVEQHAKLTTQPVITIARTQRVGDHSERLALPRLILHGAEHGEPASRGAGQQLGGQPRLADARLTRDHDRPTTPRQQRVERHPQTRQLTFAPDERRGAPGRLDEPVPNRRDPVKPAGLTPQTL